MRIEVTEINLINENGEFSIEKGYIASQGLAYGHGLSREEAIENCLDYFITGRRVIRLLDK